MSTAIHILRCVNLKFNLKRASCINKLEIQRQVIDIIAAGSCCSSGRNFSVAVFSANVQAFRKLELPPLVSGCPGLVPPLEACN